MGIVNLVLCYIAVKLDFGIRGTALSMAISYILLSVTLLYYSFKYNAYSTKQIFIKIWRLFKNVVILIISIFITNTVIHYLLLYFNVNPSLEGFLDLFLFIILAFIMAFKPVKELIKEFNILPKLFKRNER